MILELKCVFHPRPKSNAQHVYTVSKNGLVVLKGTDVECLHKLRELEVEHLRTTGEDATRWGYDPGFRDALYVRIWGPKATRDEEWLALRAEFMGLEVMTYRHSLKARIEDLGYEIDQARIRNDLSKVAELKVQRDQAIADKKFLDNSLKAGTLHE